MKEQLSVKEKYSRYWPAVTLISFVLALVFFAGYLVTDYILLEGYLRLVAFAFLAIAILSYFKVRDGQIEIQFNTDEEKNLDIAYRVGDKEIHAEKIALKEIAEVKIDQMPNRSLYNDLIKSDRCIRLKRKDAGNWLYLNEVYGRVIPLTEQNAGSILKFIRNLIRQTV